jgi:uncharacterized membrane protein
VEGRISYFFENSRKRRFVGTENDSVKKNVYYAYAAIIAFFSLVIAIAFAYFGTKITRLLGKSAKVLNTKANTGTVIPQFFLFSYICQDHPSYYNWSCCLYSSQYLYFDPNKLR